MSRDCGENLSEPGLGAELGNTEKPGLATAPRGKASRRSIRYLG